MVSGSGLAAIRVKAGSTAKRVVPVAVNPVSLVGLTLPADQQWRNAKVLKVKLQPAKRLHQRGWIGRVNENDRHRGLLQSDGHYANQTHRYLQCGQAAHPAQERIVFSAWPVYYSDVGLTRYSSHTFKPMPLLKQSEDHDLSDICNPTVVTRFSPKSVAKFKPEILITPRLDN